MIRVSDKNLGQSIKKDGIKPLYYITGNDEFLIDACVSKIVKNAIGTNMDELYRLDSVKSSAEDIEQPFFTYSFSEESKVIFFDSCELGTMKKERNELFCSLITDIPEKTVVVFKQFVDDNRFSVSKKVEAFVANCSNGVIVEVSAKRGYELESYIAALIKKQSCSALDDVPKLIAEISGDNLMQINNEVSKLASLSNYGEITSAHVKEICVRSTEASVYDMITKIERKDVRGAMLVLENMLDNRDAPLMITSALNTAFINYYRARLLKDKRLSDKQMFELFDYKGGDRKVSIACERCIRFSIKQLETIIEILYELDSKLKSSIVEERIILEQQIARIIFAAGAA